MNFYFFKENAPEHLRHDAPQHVELQVRPVMVLVFVVVSYVMCESVFVCDFFNIEKKFYASVVSVSVSTVPTQTTKASPRPPLSFHTPYTPHKYDEHRRTHRAWPMWLAS